jgi:hypothetical protein
MSTAGMMGRIAEVSPCPSARITGIVYFLYFLTAVLGEFFLKGMVVDGAPRLQCSGLDLISAALCWR